jgi:hypothetical protein
VYILNSFTAGFFFIIQGNGESNNSIDKVNTKLIQKSENLHRFHQFVLFYFTQYETKTENLKSELLYYNLAIILYNILLIESYRYAPPVQIEPVRSYYSLYHV